MNKFIVIKCGDKFWSTASDRTTNLSSAAFFKTVEEAEDALGSIPRKVDAEVGFLYFAPVDKSPPKEEEDKREIWEDAVKKGIKEWPKPLHPYQVDPNKLFRETWQKGDSGLTYDLWMKINNYGQH